MALAAKNLGYEYIGITDHSQRVTVAKGLTPKRVQKQIEAIDKLNRELKNFRILKGSEVDILEDGSLDLPDETLAKLDFTVCSIHSHFHLSRQKQTERILRAMENPYFKILGHPFGRLIGKREAYDIDMEKIINAAKKLSKVLEINCQPDRLDLPDIFCRMAKDAKVKMVVSTDAHSVSQLHNMRLGVSVARRGWLEVNDIINTMSLREITDQNYLRV